MLSGTLVVPAPWRYDGPRGCMPLRRRVPRSGPAIRFRFRAGPRRRYRLCDDATPWDWDLLARRRQASCGCGSCGRSPKRKQARHWRKMNAVVQAMTAGLDRRINTSPSGAEQSSQRGIDKAPLGCRARTSGATRRCPQPSLFRRQRALARAVPEPERECDSILEGQSAAWTDGAIRVPRTADKAAAPALRLSNGLASRSGRKPDRRSKGRT